MTRVVVAIDGPAGAGKSTVAERLARELGYLLLDSGALYRAVALAAKRAGLRWEDEPAIVALAERLRARGELVLAPGGSGLAAYEGGKGRVLLAGQDISAPIRSAEISMGASRVSAIAGVRAALLDLQRATGASGGVVAEGRDIGTVVFPRAEAKFFLTASAEVRAERRWQELRQRGEPADLAAVTAEVAQRDRQDSERSVAPLRRAKDAILVDSTGRSIDSIVAELKDAVLRVAR